MAPEKDQKKTKRTTRNGFFQSYLSSQFKPSIFYSPCKSTYQCLAYASKWTLANFRHCIASLAFFQPSCKSLQFVYDRQLCRLVTRLQVRKASQLVSVKYWPLEFNRRKEKRNIQSMCPSR